LKKSILRNYDVFCVFIKNDVSILFADVQWNNATDPITGAHEGGPTYTGASYDCRGRLWYQTSKASTAVEAASRGGAVGTVWSPPYLFRQSGTVGLTAARHLVTGEGAFVGVAGADFEMSSVEALLRDSTDASGGTLTVFVVDADGKMISSSVTRLAHAPFTLSDPLWLLRAV
jgi:hypothetical protein